MSRSFLREVVLRSPPWVILGGQVGSPGAVVIVAAAAFLSDLGERVADHRVAVQKDRTVAANLVETRPERSRVGIRHDPLIAPAFCVGELLEAHAVDRDAPEPLDGPLDSGDDLRSGFFSRHQEAHDTDAFSNTFILNSA